MEWNLITIIAAGVISIIAYLVISMVIREISTFFMKKDKSTYHNASKIAIVLTLLLVLQIFFGTIAIINVLFPILMVIILFLMTQFVYKLKFTKALLMTISNVAAFILIIMFIALVMVLWR
jgi:hypothetical protein